MTKEEIKLFNRMAEALQIIGYPRRGTWEETDFIHLQDAANYIQQNFTLAELQTCKTNSQLNPTHTGA